jgi:release factor glutamine methyltransferase
MRIGGNSLRQIKQYFESELSSLYEPSERIVLYRMAVQHVNGFSHMEIHLNPERRVSESELLAYSQFVKQLVNGVPVQYIMGYTWFMDLRIGVNSSVLIPRPETEELVHTVIPFLNGCDHASIVDLCSGSGCIALALKSLYRNATVLGVDISERAISKANENARELSLDVSFLQKDIFEKQQFAGLFDLMVSNPPYIPQSERNEMSSRVTDFEPEEALFVPNADALLFYRRIIEIGSQYLRAGGMLAFECHYKGAALVASEMKEARFSNVAILRDLSGIERFVIGYRL